MAIPSTRVHYHQQGTNIHASRIALPDATMVGYTQLPSQVERSKVPQHLNQNRNPYTKLSNFKAPPRTASSQNRTPSGNGIQKQQAMASIPRVNIHKIDYSTVHNWIHTPSGNVNRLEELEKSRGYKYRNEDVSLLLKIEGLYQSPAALAVL